MKRKVCLFGLVFLVLTGPFYQTDLASGRTAPVQVPTATRRPPHPGPGTIGPLRRLPRRPPLPTPPPRRLPARRQRAPLPGDGDAGTGMGPFTGAGAATAYSAYHQVHETLALPPVPPGAPHLFLYAPTGLNADNCLEVVTAYFRYPGDPTTRREFWIWDHCDIRGVAGYATIDSQFVNRYVVNFNGRRAYLVSLQQTGKPDGATPITYNVYLHVPAEQIWDHVYSTVLSQFPVTSGGWSAHENYFQQGGICPSLPAIAADDILVRISGIWTPTTPSNSNQILGGWCHTESPTYTFTMIDPNRTWEVRTP